MGPYRMVVRFDVWSQNKVTSTSFEAESAGLSEASAPRRRLGGALGSVYDVQALQLPRVLQQVQAALGKLQEVGSIAMAFQRLLVHILLVEHHRRGVTLHKEIGRASRRGPR